METNNSQQKVWEDRPLPSDRSWAKSGVPLEVMLELVNAIDAVPWFNIPHQADEEYIRSFATLTKEGLSNSRPVYVEHSNEVWNWQFQQAQFARSSAEMLWGTSANNAYIQWHGMRTAKICDVFKTEVFAENPDQVHCVLGVQTVWHGLENAALDCPLWAKKSGRPCHSSDIDHIAITSYFDAGLNGPITPDPIHLNAIKSFVAEGSEGVSKAFEQIKTGSKLRSVDGYQKFPGVIKALEYQLGYWTGVAKKYDASVVAYEGGQHISANSHVLQDDKSVELFHQKINRDARMGEVYLALLNVWKDRGATLHMHYDDISGWSKWGNWGMMEYLGDYDSAKYQAISKFNEANSCWWEQCQH